MPWNILDDQVNWNNISSKPSILSDNQIDWVEVQNKPLSVFNWSIAGGFEFVNDTYRNMGIFPVPFLIPNSNNSNTWYTYLIQFNIQWGDLWYHNIIGSSAISLTYWLTAYGEVERTINCEGHSQVPTILSFYLGQGYLGQENGSRNLFMKLNKNLSISANGRINIKIASLF